MKKKLLIVVGVLGGLVLVAMALHHFHLGEFFRHLHG
jgi:hypothetical protein